jgi:hypothetical protein
MPSEKTEIENQDHRWKTCPAIRALYPNLSEVEQAEAEVNFRRYLRIAVDIQRRKELASEAFDTVSNPATMKERSNVDLKI